MMKIGIDYSPVTVDQAGIGNLTKELASALLRVDQKNQYFIYTDFAEFQKLDPSYVYIPKPKSMGAGIRWIRNVAEHAKENDLDLIISTSTLNFSLFHPKVIQIVNDLAPLEYPQAFTRKQRLIYRLGLKVTANRAYGILFISETVQKEFNKQFNTSAKQTFSLLGLNEFSKMTLEAKEAQDIKLKLNLPEKYFLSVSTLEPRKNYENMIRAFAEFSKEYTDFYYLIGGKYGWMYDGLFKLVKDLGIEDKVKFLGFITDKQKHVLLTHALGFLYVSHYEGFGLPNIEAYKFGVPVLTGDIPVLKEVMQDKALYAKPNEVKDIASKMKKLIDRKVEVEPEFLARFDWDNVAKKLIELY